MSERIDIRDPDPRVEEILRDMDNRVNRTIVGLDGNPLFEPLVDDRSITYAKDGQSFSLTYEEMLYRIGRMSRDGMSIDAIRAELDVPKGLVSDKVIEDALRLGRAYLESAIADGIEPEETVRVLGYRAVEPEDDRNDATVEDSLEFGRRVVDGWKETE